MKIRIVMKCPDGLARGIEDALLYVNEAELEEFKDESVVGIREVVK